MKVKKYIGSTMQDTIFKVKADLGPEAIILNTRKFKSGLLGIFGKTKVEVLAALEEDKKEDKKEEEKTLTEINNLKNMINELNNQWKSDSIIRELPEQLALIYKHLTLQGVNSDFQRDLISQVNKKHYSENEFLKIVKERLIDFLGDSHPIDSVNLPRVVAFIGPTGVGKTTTIAKLAARYALDEEKKVALITADTYRIAAVQQLKTYSDIINVPMQVVYNLDELKEALYKKFLSYDMIFIDTAGSSWDDKLQIGRLKKLINKDLIDEIHLIISMSTKSNDIDSIIKRFSILDPDKIVLSKLDETMTYGDIINIKSRYKLPYSYLTFGQDVPDDLQVADAKVLVKYIMGDLYE
ncbi:flagellar biosynthesis protein FlhF [Natronospora cellulosivora (SeqCode)]